MRQEIHFKGLSLTPDNRHAELGALSMCAGVELHDGALRPSVLPHTQISSKLPVPSPSGFYDQYTATLRFIHQGNGYIHFIGTFIASSPAKDDVYWYDEAGYDFDHFYGGKLTGISASTITDIQAIGNTLIFICTTGIYYVLWKDDGYVELGERPPFPQLQFSLKYEKWWDTEGDTPPYTTITFSASPWQLDSETVIYSVPDSMKTEVTERVLAEVNKRVDEATGKGLFHAPFYIRYCFRLYDNKTLIWHSVPVLMFPMLKHPVFVQIESLRPDDGNRSSIRCQMLSSRLQCRCLNVSELSGLDDWGDIVKSVDIFISPQLSRINTAGLIEEIEDTRPYYSRFNESLVDGCYRLDLEDILTISGTFENKKCYLLPEYGWDSFVSRIRDNSVFRKIASFKTSDSSFSSEFADIDISGDTLKNINAQPAMTDDYHSHYGFMANQDGAKHGYVYNKRLHLFSLSETLRFPQRFDLFFPYCNRTYGNGGAYYNVLTTVYEAVVALNTESGIKYVELNTGAQNIPNQYLNEFNAVFFPDSRANEYHIKYTNGGPSGYTSYPLTAASLLEGAQCFAVGVGMSEEDIPQGDNVTYDANKIYVSEIANPFYFPVESRVTVGIGAVIALATTTRALSQGQFGQYPLIAFCSDGIWALDVSPTGTYQSVHPISREVCVNASSVCQLDQSVLFATNRGLSRIVESQVASVSDALDGPLFDISKLSYVTQFDQGTEDLLDFAIHPVDFFRQGMLVYDFINSRVIVVKQGVNAAYVLSLRDGTWSTMSITAPQSIANAYPYPYYQTGGGALWHLDKGYDYADGSLNGGIVVTRSISFATTMQVIQAFQQLNDCTEVPLLYLHGSNDDINWKYIGHVKRNHAPYLPGHPYRFFRISVYIQMRTWEKYSSLILDVIEKYEKL